MTDKTKSEITKISKEFADGMSEMFPEINGTGWLIVDPLAGYLNYIGHKNTCKEIPETADHPQVLIIVFEDGTEFIPAGEDLKGSFKDGNKEMKNWMWI